MKSKKSVLIICIFIILIAALIFAYMYIYTDLFKSSGDLFKKYLSKVEIMDKDFLTQCANVNNKKSNNSNSTNTNIDIYAKTLDADTNSKLLSAKIDSLKNVNLNQAYSVVRLSNNEKELAVIKYVKDGNVFALGADNILTKYISVENNNLREFYKKLGIENVESLPDSIKSVNYNELITVNEETLNLIKEKYCNLIFNNISDEAYSKTKNEDNSQNVILTLSANDLSTIIQKVLEEAQNDETVLKLIQEKMNLLDYQIEISDIQLKIKDCIEEIKGLESENVEIKMSLNIKDKNVAKISFELIDMDENIENEAPDSMLFEIYLQEKNKITFVASEDEEQVNCIIDYSYSDTDIISQITVNDGTNEIMYFKNTIKNYNTEKIENELEIKVSNGTEEYALNEKSETNFKEDIQIEKLTTENSARIDNLDETQIQTLIQGIANRVVTLYGNELKKLEI